MIKFECTGVIGFPAAIRGMRNPMNSWEKSDSEELPDGYKFGANDFKLAMKLADAGSVHAKYRRMIVVYVDITAPLYWWKEFDTYKVGTVANSCSTMHKIHEQIFDTDDFSCEKLLYDMEDDSTPMITDDSMYGRHNRWTPKSVLMMNIYMLNKCREMYLKTKDKKYWWQMIQLLPSSYNQKRTVMLNYEVLSNIYHNRKDHKLDEWRDFCGWIEKLPCSKLITGNMENESD